MAKEKREPSLRYVVGVLSVEQRRMQAGKFPLEPTKVFKEDRIRTGRGTPGQRKPARAMRHRRNDQVIIDPARTSVFEALCEFSNSFRRNTTHQTITLSFGIAVYVDAERLLPQFSTVMAAIACTVMAGHALGYGFILRKRTMREAQICPQATRLCYNELWLKREALRGVIVKRGGNPDLLPLPTDVRGNLDTVYYLKDTGHFVELEVLRRSHKVACGRKSFLSIVQNVDADHTTEVPRLQTEAQSESDQGAEHSDSDDSWEDWDGDVEMFDLEIGRLEPLCRQ